MDIVRGYSRLLMLFDLDDTLVDHDSAEVDAITGWIRDAGFPPEVNGVPSAGIWREVSEAVFPEYFAGRTTFEEQRRLWLRRFLPRMGVQVSTKTDAELDRLFQECRSRYEAAWCPFPDVAESLTRLASRYRLAILTNGDQVQQDDKVRRTGLTGFIEATTATSSLGVAKPHPEAFLAALRRLGAMASTTVYVGDRLDIDAQAATAAGLTGVWLNRTGDTRDPGEMRTITTLADLV